MNRKIERVQASVEGFKLYLLAIVGLLVGLFSSCVKEPAEVFDKSASERVNELTAEVQKLLASSSTGWVLEYYPHSQLHYGGYPIGLTFGSKNEVLISSDAPVAGHTATEVKSNYHLKADKMVSLSFDTYSSALHFFSDPDKSHGAGEGKGFQGDYEFTFIRSISADTLYVKGRKTGVIMRMFRPQVASKQYIADVLALKARAYTSESMYQAHLHGLTGTLGGKRVVVYLNNSGYNLLSIEDQQSGKKAEVPYHYTPEGIRFFRAYNGVVELKWKDADKSYNTADGEKLTARPDPDYPGFARFLGTYELKCTNWPTPRIVTFTQAARNVYRITGIAPNLKIYATYNAAQDRFEIKTQKLENTGGAYLCVWAFPLSGNLSWGSGYGMYSKRNTSYTQGEQYTMVDNGEWGNFKAGSFLFWKPGSGEYTAFGIRMPQPVFTKQ